MIRAFRVRVISSVLSVLAAILVSAALLGASGCTPLGGASAEAPTSPAGITGEITNVEPSERPGVVCTMLVEGGKQPAGAVSDKAMVTVTDETRITRADEREGAQSLAVGMTVRVWFEGPVAESYPVQGTAGFVEIQ